jgi:hypothetical protein
VWWAAARRLWRAGALRSAAVHSNSSRRVGDASQLAAAREHQIPTGSLTDRRRLDANTTPTRRAGTGYGELDIAHSEASRACGPASRWTATTAVATTATAAGARGRPGGRTAATAATAGAFTPHDLNSVPWIRSTGIYCALMARARAREPAFVCRDVRRAHSSGWESTALRRRDKRARSFARARAVARASICLRANLRLAQLELQGPRRRAGQALRPARPLRLGREAGGLGGGHACAGAGGGCRAGTRNGAGEARGDCLWDIWR